MHKYGPYKKQPLGSHSAIIRCSRRSIADIAGGFCQYARFRPWDGAAPHCECHQAPELLCASLARLINRPVRWAHRCFRPKPFSVLPTADRSAPTLLGPDPGVPLLSVLIAFIRPAACRSPSGGVIGRVFGRMLICRDHLLEAECSMIHQQQAASCLFLYNSLSYVRFRSSHPMCPCEYHVLEA